MSWDLDEAEARELAQEYLAAMRPPEGGDDEWVITKVAGRDWGWIVSWVNKRAFEGSRDARDLYAGGGPFLIDRKTGRVAMCESAHPVDYWVAEWHAGRLADRPRPA